MTEYALAICLNAYSCPKSLSTFWEYALAMPVTMMQIGKMRVSMMQRFVAVPVRMRLAHLALMRMLVVSVMHMAMFMLQRTVLMVVTMALGEMQPKSGAHEN